MASGYAKRLWQLWRILIDHVSYLCHISVIFLSSSNTSSQSICKVARRTGETREENNPLRCLRNGSSMILQSFLLGSFERSFMIILRISTVADGWLWVALQGRISLLSHLNGLNGRYGNHALFASHGSTLKGDNQTTMAEALLSVVSRCFKHHFPSAVDENASPAYFLAMLRTAAAPRQSLSLSQDKEQIASNRFKHEQRITWLTNL